MVKQYLFARSFLILIIPFLFITIFTGCNSTNTSKTYRHPLTRKTIVLQPTIIHGDPSVLNEAIELNQLDKKPVQNSPFRTPPMSLYYATQNKIGGKVLLLLVIDEKGDVIYVETKEPVPGLNEPAVEAALQLKFKPGEVNGKPVKVAIKLPWVFNRVKIQDFQPK
jgi:TonB family protein